MESDVLESANTYGEVEVIRYHGLLSRQKHADVSDSDGWGKGSKEARARVGPDAQVDG